MSQSWIKGMLDGISAKTVVFAVIAGTFCALFQFYLNIQEFRSQNIKNMDQLLTTLEKPAARAVLILDSELAQDIVDGLTLHDFMREARIYEDHNAILGESINDRILSYTMYEKLVAAVIGTEISVTKPLHLPESMSEESGQIQLIYNPTKAVMAIMPRLRYEISFTFILAAMVTIILLSYLTMLQLRKT